MLVVVRGMFLALTVTLGFVSAGNSAKATPPTTTSPQTITVIDYRQLALPTTTTTVPVVKPPLVDEKTMAPWYRVAQCESHQNWSQVNYGSHSYSGALGIRNDVWAQYGGRQFGETAGNASPQEQVFIARRIQASNGFPDYVPDQDGQCQAW